MEQCARCGHALGIGRFCVNCGHPIAEPASEDDWRSSTAERPAISIPPPPAGAGPTGPPPAGPPPTAPPPAYVTPRPVNYPLFADEVDYTVVARREPAELSTTSGQRTRRGRRVLSWLLAALALLCVGAVGVTLAAANDDTLDQTTDRSTPSDASSSAAQSSPPTSQTQPPASEPAEPAGKPTDVTSRATITAPVTAPPSQDVNGNAVRYEAFNMLDGVHDTCWRMPGDGRGSVIVIQLAEPTSISTVGLINGYTKRQPGYDGYPANRRITRVRWTFDDGSTASQDLAEERDLQSIDVGPVVTTTVRLRILDVTAPGPGRSGRDYTAISDVALLGASA